MQAFISETQIENRTIEQCMDELHYDKHFNCINQDYLGRKNESEVLCMQELRRKLASLNYKLTDCASIDEGDIDTAVAALTDIDPMADPNDINIEMMGKLRDGVKVKILQRDGSRKEQTMRFFDFDKPERNSFFLVNQLWIKGNICRCRPDVIIYVNGIPLITIELKDSNIDVRNAYDDNLTRYKEQIPQLMYYNVLLVASNGIKTLTGATFSTWEYFKPWLHADDESKAADKKRIEELGCSLEYFVLGLLDKKRLLDYVQNFMLILDGKKKICAQNHQFLGVNHAIDRFSKIISGEIPAEERGKLGVFWHTQGSGKSFSMVFFARKVKRMFSGNYTFLVVTDREDLDGQIYKNFLRSGFMSEKYECRPASSEKLREMLSAKNKSIVFTLIQKFRYPQNEKFPLLSNRSDIIVLIDEAHRSQYKSLAENLRTGLPNAMYMAFTGTPLFGSRQLTNQWFGDTVSEYNFMQAVEDDATRRIIYKNHLPEMQQQNPHFTEEFEEIISADNLSDEEAAKLENEHATELEVLRRPARLDVVAKDIVDHFPWRGYLGKAMVISVDKFTCVRMYDAVQTYWRQAIQKLSFRINATADDEERRRLMKLREWMERTEMAVVVSHEDGEDEKFRNEGLDIALHRRKMEEIDDNGKDIVDRFKAPDDPLRIVFVCAMWLTGFDAPEVSTLYLDKPMNGHTLMQTIARANRVTDVLDIFGRPKTCGEVISYCNLYVPLMKAIGIYGDNSSSSDENGIGIVDSTDGTASTDGTVSTDGRALPMTLERQYQLLREAIGECEQWCGEIGIDLKAILDIKDVFQNIALFDNYADTIVANQDRKRQFKLYDNAISNLYDSCLPDIIQRKDEFRLAQVIHYLRNVIDNNADRSNIDSARRQIRELLDHSIMPARVEGIAAEPGPETAEKGRGENYVIRQYAECDLSRIDIAKVKEKFKEAPHKNIEIQDLAQLLEVKLRQMLSQNSERTSFAERLQQILDNYNSGSVATQESMDELLAFMNELSEEQQRAQRFGLTEQELEIYDMLLKPKLTKKDEQKVKVAAKDLLAKLRENQALLFPLRWYQSTQTKQALYNFIGDSLDATLPESYGRNEFAEKKDKIYSSLLMRGDGARMMFVG